MSKIGTFAPQPVMNVFCCFPYIYIYIYIPGPESIVSLSSKSLDSKMGWLLLKNPTWKFIFPCESKISKMVPTFFFFLSPAVLEKKKRKEKLGK